MFNFKYAAFLRHGEAQNNEAEKRHAAGDVSAYSEHVKRPPAFHALTDIGRQQALYTGMWLKFYNLKFDHHVISSYVRAMQTAALLGIDDAYWIIDERICEKDAGVFHEMTPIEATQYRSQFRNRGPELMSYRWRPDRGHSFFDTEMIARSYMGSLQNATLSVCHGHKMRVIDHIIMGGENAWHMESWQDQNWQVPHCTLIEYRQEEYRRHRAINPPWSRRVSDPCNDRLGTWQEIVPPRYSNDELEELIGKVLSKL